MVVVLLVSLPFKEHPVGFERKETKSRILRTQKARPGWARKTANTGRVTTWWLKVVTTSNDIFG